MPHGNLRSPRRHIGMVFQQYNLFPHRTALQNVMMAPIQVLHQPRKEVKGRVTRRTPSRRAFIRPAPATT